MIIKGKIEGKRKRRKPRMAYSKQIKKKNRSKGAAIKIKGAEND